MFCAVESELVLEGPECLLKLHVFVVVARGRIMHIVT